MDLLLIHLPLGSLIRIPTGLLSIADWIERRGGEVEIHDGRLWADRVNGWLLAEKIERARFVGVSMMTVQIPWFLSLLDGFGSFLRGKLILGGIHPTLFPDQCKSYCDFVCSEAGEDFTAQILGCNGQAFDYAATGPRNYDLVDLDVYMALGHTIHDSIIGPGHVTVETSRGCNARCAFCVNTCLPWGHPWRPRDLDVVVAECDRLIARGATRFTWDDDYFLADARRAVELVQRVRTLCPEMTWGASARVRDVVRNADIITELAHDGGLRSLNIGIESGSARILQLLRKPHTPSDAVKCAEILAHAGVRAIYSYMKGVPTESDADRRETAELAKQIQTLHENSRTSPPGGTFQQYRPLPGTELAAMENYRWPSSLPQWNEWLRTDEAKGMQF